MTHPRRPFEINVGFLINAAVGTCHDFPFHFEKVDLGDDLTVNSLDGTANFSRIQQGLLLRGDFHAQLDLECVRCLEPYAQVITLAFTDLYAFDKRSLSESNLLVPEEGKIDLAPLLREYALLEIPIQPICVPDCKGLCPECGGNLNQKDCGHRPAADESPFAALKDIFQ